MTAQRRIDVPLRVHGVEHFIDRTYHEGGRFQWARETFKNAEEAGARRVLFGVEWQGVERHGVYRQLIADDGPGMDEEELQAFFRTYGNSGKAIGGLHENFGIGAKSSLLPWNHQGLIIVSYHADYSGPLIMWLLRDPVDGEYKVRNWEADNGEGRLVVGAHEVDLDGSGMLLDFADVAPEFVREAGHGTVLLLLGNNASQHTILGDPHPARAEDVTLDGKPAAPGRALRTYLDRRLWDVNDLLVEVTEFATGNPAKWPTTPKRGSEAGQWNRRVHGAWHLIDFQPTRAAARGKIADSGTVPMSDGTQLDWYLWDGDRSGMGRDFEDAFIAARYSPTRAGGIDELFDVADDGRAQYARYRQFGVSDPIVSKRLWLIARPPLGGDDGSYGVYMSSDRNHLHIQGGPHASDPLPWSTWAEEFANDPPEAVRQAIIANRSDDPSDPTDEALRARLAERFSRRFRTMRLRAQPDGTDIGGGGSGGSASRRGAPAPKRIRPRSAPSGTTGRGGENTSLKPRSGTEPGMPKPASVGMPQAEWSDPETVEQLFPPGMIGLWTKPNAMNPDGLIQLNPGHPVIDEELTHWKLQYPPHLEADVEKVILDVYRELAITAVAHSAALRPFVNTSQDHDQLLEPPGLTMAVLGIMGADAVIGPRLGKLGVKRLSEARTA